MKDRKKLRPEQRLRKQRSFKHLVEKGGFARGKFFFIWAVSQKELGENDAAESRPSLGVVVNRKTQARATARNVLKRLVREVFRIHQNELKDNIAILVKAKEGCRTPSFQEAEKDLTELFEKAGTLK